MQTGEWGTDLRSSAIMPTSLDFRKFNIFALNQNHVISLSLMVTAMMVMKSSHEMSVDSLPTWTAVALLQRKFSTPALWDAFDIAELFIIWADKLSSRCLPNLSNALGQAQ